MCGVCALTDNNKQECGCMCVCITGVCGCSGSEVGLVEQTKKVRVRGYETDEIASSSSCWLHRAKGAKCGLAKCSKDFARNSGFWWQNSLQP